MRNAHLNDNADLAYADNVKQEWAHVRAIKPTKQWPEEVLQAAAEVGFLKHEYNRAFKEKYAHTGNDEIELAILSIALTDAGAALKAAEEKLQTAVRAAQ